jgi:hypothetical protein
MVLFTFNAAACSCTFWRETKLKCIVFLCSKGQPAQHPQSLMAMEASTSRHRIWLEASLVMAGV